MWNDLCLVGVGKIAPKCQVSIFFLFRAAQSVKTISTFLDEG